MEVIAGLKEMDKFELGEQIYRNTCTLFNWPI